MAEETQNEGSVSTENLHTQDTGADEAPPAAATQNPNFKWYILHAYSGFERKVKESIESRVQAYGLHHKIGRVLIPTEPVTEIRNGKKYTIERAFLPGYVLVEMALDDEIWHLLKNTPKVTGFLGTGKFAKNESVKITEGPFASFTGLVDEVNEDKEEVTVMVTIFGRSTPVKLEYKSVEKV